MRDLVYVLMIVVAVAYAAMKLLFTYRWWLHGAAFWREAFHPLPAADPRSTYGYLLGAKWIGTRNLWLGVSIGVVLALQAHDGVGLLLAMGAGVELCDGSWLAYGKYRAGWQGPKTSFYMRGAFVWVPVLVATSIGFFAR